jgi:type VI secretion system secreted protein VgrG
MAIKTTQNERLIQLSTPLPKDYLLIERLRCTEGLNQLFHIDLEILHEEQFDGFEPTAVDPQALLGFPMIISAHQPGPTTRYFHGICVSFSQGARNQRFSSYRAELRPKVWVLTQVHRSRIFQNKTVPQIIDELLEGYEFDNEIDTSGFEPRNYCVQYRESDWAFLSRLMEEEGIYYYFEHTKDNHRLVIGNTKSSHRGTPTADKITFAIERSELPDKWIPAIYRWRQEDKMLTGKVELRDFNFQLPTNDLRANETSIFDIGKNKELEIYDWPGEYAKRFDAIDPSGDEDKSRLDPIFQDRERVVKIRQEELDVAYKMSVGVADCCAITAGYKFSFIDHPNKKLNIDYVVVTAVHDALQSPFYISDERVGDPYVVNFTCIPHGAGHAPFRPERRTPKPIVHGSQTAMVVGNPGDEIFTDKYGRVKVHFHWDRSEYNDQRASAWIRVGTMIAGDKWGSMFIPRVGQEVIVDFLEGDPDQPIIVGSVYNEKNQPHYELDKYKTMSYFKSKSTPKANGFNEIRFEDKAKKEQVFIHSQKRYDLRARGSMYETCGGNRQENIGYKVKNGDDEDRGGNLAITVGGNYDLHVYGDQFIGIDKSLYEGVKSDVAEEYKGKQQTVVTGKRELNAQSITLEALTKITLKVGSSFITLDLSGVSISGPFVKINSGGSATATSDMNFADPVDAEHADTGEPGYLDKPRTGGGTGGRRWRTVGGQHAPVVRRKDDGSGNIMVGNAIVIRPSATNPNFQQEVLEDLAEISNHAQGRETLNSIENSGRTVGISEGDANETNFADNNDAAAAGKPALGGGTGTGNGTDSEITYNRTPLPTAADPSIDRPGDVALHHELAHADDGAHGRDDDTPDPAHPARPADGFKGQAIAESNVIERDNNYRDSRGIPQRQDHSTL